MIMWYGFVMWRCDGWMRLCCLRVRMRVMIGSLLMFWCVDWRFCGVFVLGRFILLILNLLSVLVCLS